MAAGEGGLRVRRLLVQHDPGYPGRRDGAWPDGGPLQTGYKGVAGGQCVQLDSAAPALAQQPRHLRGQGRGAALGAPLATHLHTAQASRTSRGIYPLAKSKILQPYSTTSVFVDKMFNLVLAVLYYLHK